MNNIKEDPKEKEKLEKQEPGVNLSLDFNELKALFTLLRECKIHEFELEKEGLKIKVTQEGQHTHSHVDRTASREAEYGRKASEGTVPLAEQPDSTGAVAAPVEETRTDLLYITSPMVGTFYRSTTPGGDAFCDIGQKLKVGQVVCIIEAMKIMNEIESDVEGEVVAIYVGNAEPVEFGKKLIAVKKGIN